ncbi:MAG: DUF1926 domain-containing protein [Acidobacteria bacterium]|nr:DUF1926 domain-containing protein [Acidobacteriota bacterium]
MNKAYLIFGIHCHQPVGNFPEVLEHAYHRSYLPLLQVLCEFPEVKLCYHCSGYLLEWIGQHHPDYFPLLRDRVLEGQVELMTGGFYEPIFPVIPARDRVGQIRLLSRFLAEHFKTEPKGMWLAERVWEPHLAKEIRQSGVEYVVVDDYHFKSVGRRQEELCGYFNTEEDGYVVSVFPISEELRYAIPFKQPEVTLDCLRKVSGRPRGNLLLMIDDAEKFGVWPGTYDWVHEKQWLRGFFRALVENRSWLETITCQEYRSRFPPLGNVYLPTASYFEMSQWSLPAEAGAAFEEALEEIRRLGWMDRLQPFLKGGFWRNFLVKYPESNALHKKMLYVSEKVKRHGSQPLGSGEAPFQVSEEQRELYKGQCNDSYWHGVFGGLYLPHLRHAAFSHLIRAEKLVDALRQPSGAWVESQVTDLDKDGRDEILLSSDRWNAYLKPASGGALFELDWKEKEFNLTNTLARWPESYHRKMQREAEQHQQGGEGEVASIHQIRKSSLSDEKLVYDGYSRLALIDHFLEPGVGADALRLCQYLELGDFVRGEYRARVEEIPGGVQASLERDGRVELEGRGWPVRVRKQVRLWKEDPRLEMAYQVANEGDGPLLVCFSVEFNFGLLGADDVEKYCEIPDGDLKFTLRQTGLAPHVRGVSIRNGRDGFRVVLGWDVPGELGFFPVETISQSESGYEKTYQGSSFWPRWHLHLEPERAWSVGLTLQVESC